MNRLILLAPMLLFGLGGSYLLFLFWQPGNEGRIFDNLVPELIGFCLEGFFLIGLFSLIQRRRERERRHAFQLIWAVGMLFFGIASACEAIASAAMRNSQPAPSDRRTELISFGNS